MSEGNVSSGMAVRAFIIVLCSTCAVTTSSLFVRFSTCPAMVLAAYRNCIAAILLIPLILTKYREEFLSIDKKTAAMSALAGVCFAIHLSLYFIGVQNTTIAASQVLTSLEVIVVALFLFVTGKEKYSLLGWAGIAITIAGGVIVSLSAKGTGDTTLFGNAMSAASSVFIAAWTLISNKVRKKVSNIPHVFIAFLSAGIFLSITVPASGTPLFGYGAINYVCALAMAVVCSLLSHAVFTWAFKYISPTTVTLTKLDFPVWGVMWGILFFSELPSVNQIIGGIILTFGIALYILKKN